MAVGDPSFIRVSATAIARTPRFQTQFIVISVQLLSELRSITLPPDTHGET
jgi:hypothetical protein